MNLHYWNTHRRGMPQRVARLIWALDMIPDPKTRTYLRHRIDEYLDTALAALREEDAASATIVEHEKTPT